MSNISWHRDCGGILEIRIKGIGRFVVTLPEFGNTLYDYFSQAYVVLTGKEISKEDIEENWEIKNISLEKPILFVGKR